MEKEENVSGKEDFSTAKEEEEGDITEEEP